MAAKAIVTGLLLLCTAVFCAEGRSFLTSTPGRRKLAQRRSYDANLCQQQAYITNLTTRDVIFDQLSPEEYLSVARFVVDQLNVSFAADLVRNAPDTNRLQADDTSLPDEGTLKDVGYTDNTIYNIFLLPPNKTEAVYFLDSGGPAPGRFARVIVVRGGYVVPDTMEYKVGPLPIGPYTTIEPLLADGAIPWFKRPADDRGERGEWADLRDATNAALTPLFLAVTGQCLDDNNTACQDNNISQWSQASYIRNDGTQRIRLWYHFLDAVQGGSADDLFPIPIYFKFNLTDPDPTNWSAFDFEHCTQWFPTAQALVAALAAGTLKICTIAPWTAAIYNPMWTNTDWTGSARLGADIPGPRLYEPAGKRFQLSNGASPTSRGFSWLDWEGHVTVEPWRGLQLHDIKFKGERILYELALQEQYVGYSGMQSIGSAFDFDSLYQIGGSQYPLRPGYDCPETAAYQDLNVMGSYGQIVSYKGAVCFFEDYTGTTIWRHFDYEDDADGIEVATDRGVRGYEFVIRSIATVGNYDYVYDIRFKLDGEIAVKVFMAGYMQCTFWDADHGITQPDVKFGTRVHEKTTGNLHDHLSAWKLDFDINGPVNTAHKTTVRAGTFEQIFGKGTTPPYDAPTVAFKYLDDEVVATEQGWKLNFLQPSIFTVANDAAKDAWGNSRSYAIQHQYTAPQLLPDAHPLLGAAAWSKYNVAFSKFKQDEPFCSTSYYDAHAPQNPITSLDTIVDGEAIAEDDLVAWVSMGIIHVPRQEDVPLISNVGSEFQLKPVNFFSQLAALDIVESDDFEACTPRQGSELFDYKWTGSGNNEAFDQSSVTVGTRLARPHSAKPATPKVTQFEVLSTNQRLGPLEG